MTQKWHKMIFLLLPLFITSKKCADLDPWLLNCSFPPYNTTLPYEIDCPDDGKYPLECYPFEGIDCEGETKVIQTLQCYPSHGKDPGIALCLSVVLGFLGADRFYLGYPTIGLFKLFTGGFFGLGWYIDIFLIALRIVKPARGGVYMFKEGANFRIRLPGPNFY
ncbi:TM2 domain containing protein [Tritrichomonas foetus]|uniref:TM2 domain containing protein n=1 Tax=Tritrichomonas foetus TaxID=1144522 RepID=A0A1J4KS41_9EUKA|nr:TM2 domain containing protein [Tritrichomonas foetus]|eukprot:OHT12636.1 TM2 domain containing protein [Tritrichomonas foetus]